MSRTVCYLERTRQGAILQRVRLVAPGFDRAWTARPIPDGAVPSPDDALASIRAAAAWTVEQLGPDGRELSNVVVDADGSICSWLSSPSESPGALRAAISQAAASSGDVNATGVASAAVFSDANSMGSDRSLQALPLVRHAETNGTLNGKAGAHPARAGASLPASRERYAVLSIADAPVRLFLDELDRLNVSPASVSTLWHAVSRAWDPGAPLRDERLARVDAEAGARAVIDSTPPASAVVLVEPSGRLIWSWSIAGSLVAAGAIRLRPLARRRTDGSMPSAGAPPTSDQPAPPSDLLSEPASGIWRVPADERRRPEAPETPAVEWTSADSGRLAADWLAWSAQLGLTPHRIVCLGPEIATPAMVAPVQPAGAAPPAEIAAAPASLAEALAVAWPGAAVDGSVEADPLTATLERLAALAPEPSLPAAPEADIGPSGALVELSHRPGRAHRRMYLSFTLAVLAAAVAVGALGYMLSRSAHDAESLIAAAEKERMETLEGFETVVPGLSKAPDPLAALITKSNELRLQSEAIVKEKPVLAELAHLLGVLEPFQDRINITKVSLGTALMRVTLTVTDASTGPEITQRLNNGSGIEWSGNSGGGTTTERNWILYGKWRTAAPATGAPIPTPAPAPTTTAPAPTPAPAGDAPEKAPADSPAASPPPEDPQPEKPQPETAEPPAKDEPKPDPAKEPSPDEKEPKK